VLSRDQLLDLARGRAAIPFDRSIDVQVMRLRRKIETDSKTPQIIATVRGGGYTFTPAVKRA
jgi:two-component system OmpR family response regulator